MNAIELYHQDGRSAGVFYCSECKCVARTQAQADHCCAPYQCTECGIELPRKEHRTACPKCIAKKEREHEAARFAAAEKVTEWDGWLYTDEVQGYNDGYYAHLGQLLEYIEEQTPDPAELANLTEDERSEIPTLPAYLWTCNEDHFATADISSIIQQIEERGYDDFDGQDLDGIEALTAAIDTFNQANHHHITYTPNFKVAFIPVLAPPQPHDPQP